MITDNEKEILTALANSNMNISKAAKELYMHRNTIVYHLNKIKRKYGLNPKNFFELVELLKGDYNTNYDRIKSMSVDEMAEFLIRINCIGDSISFCQNTNECNEMLDSDKEIPEKMCSACMKHWLLQESSDK